MNLILKILVLLGLLAGSGQQAAGQPAQLPTAETTIRQLGTAFVQAPTHVGLSVGIVRGGRASFYHFGTVRRGTTQLPTDQTGYEIGSVSKTFASLLLAQAVVEKRVRLTDDIRQYLDGAYPNLAYAGQPIRLLHLANTTSELPDNLPGPQFYAGVAPDSLILVVARRSARYTREQFFQDLHHVTLAAAPGQTPRHSNVAAQLLGYLLENVYRQPFEELLRTRLMQPLGMQPAPPAALAVGYDERGQPMPGFTMPTMLAAAGLRCSPADLARYVAYQLDERQPAVTLSHQITWGTLDTEGVALNWLVSKTMDGKRRLRHSGGTWGFSSYCDLYPDQHTGLLLLANEAGPGTQDALKALSQQILAALYGEPAGWAALQAGLRQQGYPRLATLQRQVRPTHPELHLTEDAVNEWGYALAGTGRLADALEVFKLNVSLYPRNWNTYDSLAETYDRLGNRALAVKNYRRSLALNAGNAGARDFLQKANMLPVNSQAGSEK